MAGVTVQPDIEPTIDELSNIDELPITDELLAELAMSADPDAPIPDDAVPFGSGELAAGAVLLPSWYMPTPAGRPGRVRRLIFAALVCSLLVANVVGFCVTNGFPEFVW